MAKSVGQEHERVTLQTIADKLGLSRTTISNAYGRPDQLAPALRATILETASSLGYCGPNAAASALRRGRSGAVGLIHSESLSYAVGDPAAVLFLQGLAEIFDDEGTSLLILPTPLKWETGISAVQEAVIDAFIIYSVSEGDPRIAPVMGRHIPVVVVDEPRRPNAAFIGIDDFTGARQVAQHLLDLGHRRFGIVSFPLIDDGFTGWVSAERRANATYPVTSTRLLGYEKAITEAGIDWNSIPIYEGKANLKEVGQAGAEALLSLERPPTAIIAISDQLALGAFRAARSHGLEVPAVLSIAGFDDIPAATSTQPALTTVRQPLRQKGSAAARLVIEGWDPVHPHELILPTELVVRDSTGPVPM